MSQKTKAYPRKYRMQDVYREMIVQFPETKKLIPVQSMHTKILKAIFDKIFYEILYNLYAFNYKQFGVFQLFKFMPESKELEDGRIVTNKPIDVRGTLDLIKATGDRSKRVYFNNEATGGYVFRLLWVKDRCNIQNKGYYKFKVNTTKKTELSRIARTGKLDAPIINYKL